MSMSFDPETLSMLRKFEKRPERKPDRIDDVIEAIREEWKKHPNMRLMQLLLNAIKIKFPTMTELYNIEDGTLVNCVEEFYDRLNDLDKG